MIAVLTLFSKSYSQSKPNIIFILADDMGYSDIGCYGGEVATPNIDKLAKNGVKFNQFYNTARCCPTRASLLTGLYPHNTGLGYMTGFNQNAPGYKGEIGTNCVTIPEVLKTAGYHSYMAGKWHVSINTKNTGPKNNWPLQRGFERYFGTIPGSGSFFTPKGLAAGNTIIKAPANFYYTDAISDTASKYISEHVQKVKNDPFFLYVAYTAPHWPLHAKPQDIQKYMKIYEQGWDELRMSRYNRMIRLGILAPTTKLTKRTDTVPAWKTIPAAEKALWIKRMAIYAAQIDCMDQGIGRIMETLEKHRLTKNTLVIFMSDNGGCAETISNTDKSIEALGTVDSFESYRTNWANLSNTPFKLYKCRVHEGGISAPFIASWQGHLATNGTWIKTPAHVIDLMPTFMQLAGAKYPSSFKGNAIHPVQGVDIMPLLKGKTIAKRTLYWEHEANRAILLPDGWKLVSKSSNKAPFAGPWELYNLNNDRSETTDLANRFPAKVKAMSTLWTSWANQNHVFPLDGTDLWERGRLMDREN
ncbi:MAG: arylsulfatase [Pedobacter sp.]|nr:arylsulfatase [Pedobacter sp.]MDQ8052106.1 arylsulfatase [Pedobacter sp.]